MRGLVLLDRDGTINVEKHYLSSPEELELLPGAAEGIRLLRGLGLAVVVVTNQSAVGRGYFSLDRLQEIHDRLGALLARHGTAVDAIYFCPHQPEDGCLCRKPAPGMARQAADAFGATLEASFVVGDRRTDIDLGREIGATTFLVRTGYGKELTPESAGRPDYVVEDLLEAAHLIQGLHARQRSAEVPL